MGGTKIEKQSAIYSIMPVYDNGAAASDVAARGGS